MFHGETPHCICPVFLGGAWKLFLSLFRDAARWPGVLNHLYILYRGEKMRV